MKCPLCGNEFQDDEAHCKGCPINRECSTVCCPNCGYQTIEKSGLINWFKKRFTGEENNAGNK
jgi:hypothetical protein